MNPHLAMEEAHRVKLTLEEDARALVAELPIHDRYREAIAACVERLVERHLVRLGRVHRVAWCRDTDGDMDDDVEASLRDRGIDPDTIHTILVAEEGRMAVCAYAMGESQIVWDCWTTEEAPVWVRDLPLGGSL